MSVRAPNAGSERRASFGTAVAAALAARLMPLAEAASHDLPIGRLLRLSLFQVSVGMAVVLLNGALNRVMIVELGVPAWLVSAMVALPLLFAPARALIGFKSDTHRSAFGWRRGPYIYIGSLLQFGGLAIMPFAVILLSGDSTGPEWAAHVGAALAFLLVGAGLHTTQTAGLALATDLAPEEARPRVVALLYAVLLIGMALSAFIFGALLTPFSQITLIQVIQGAAVVTVILNFIALWKQEPRTREASVARSAESLRAKGFIAAFRAFGRVGRTRRVLLAVFLGTAAFSMQDILLEPYGGQILGLSVGSTTTLTALLAGGTLAGLALAARALERGQDPYRLAAFGALLGVPAFCLVIFAAPLESAFLFRAGAALIGLGAGLFGVGTLTAAMALGAAHDDQECADDQDAAAARLAGRGLALGAWSAVQATAAGLAIAAGGALRDVFTALAMDGRLGAALALPAVGYSVVYHVEILLLFATLVVIGPLAEARRRPPAGARRFGLAEFPN